MILTAHGWSLGVRPDLGGAIDHLRHGGRDILRPTPPDAKDALDTACFPLVPYANRIAHGRFTVDREHYRLPLNFGDHPHSLHGFGWQAPWQIVTHQADVITLRHDFAGGAGWPWSYRAEQRFELSPQLVRATLNVTNLSAGSMPVGLGFHPYFPLDAGTRLTFDAARSWDIDSTVLPTLPLDSDYFGDWKVGQAVAGDRLIDNSFEGWDGAALILQSDRAYRMVAEGAAVLHLYRPPDHDFFCVEPVSHLPDAINRGGMPMLAPGAQQSLRMTLTV